MAHEKPWTKALHKAFSHKPVFDLRELSGIFECSGRTVLRYLKWTGYHTSYNYNSRYYTLEGIPRFDEEGLWGYEGIWFSRYGILQETVRRQVEKSDVGMSGRDLRAKLHTRVTNHMRTLLRDGVVVAETYDHLRVYYSRKERKRSVQMRRREKLLEERSRGDKKELLSTRQSALEVVEVLVTKIAHPGWGVEEISRDLVHRGIGVPVGRVRGTFEQFRLCKKNSGRKM